MSLRGGVSFQEIHKQFKTKTAIDKAKDKKKDKVKRPRRSKTKMKKTSPHKQKSSVNYVVFRKNGKLFERSGGKTREIS